MIRREPHLADVAPERPIAWAVSPEPVAYTDAVAAMEARVAAIAAGDAMELIWLLEHPPLYTAGTSARPADLLQPGRFPVFKTGRGGQYTYHGPGQRVVYVMLNLHNHNGDVRAFVHALEAWVLRTLQTFSITGAVHADRVGVWVAHDTGGRLREDKIAAIGVRVRRWVSFHGLSLNVAPDLTHFDGIVPCGISDFGVTSLAALGRDVSMADVDQRLRQTFGETFGERVLVDEASPSAPVIA